MTAARFRIGGTGDVAEIDAVAVLEIVDGDIAEAEEGVVAGPAADDIAIAADQGIVAVAAVQRD